MTQSSQSPSAPEASALIASLLSLMTRFSCLGCPQQALLIRKELALLLQYPDSDVAPLIKQVARRIDDEWATLHFAISDHPMESSEPTSLH